MEKDFIIASFITPFTVSVTIVVAGTLFLVVYDILRWRKENKKRKLNVSPTKPVPFKKFVHTLREHKEVCKIFYQVCIRYAA